MPKTLLDPEWIRGGGVSFPASIASNTSSFTAVDGRLHIVDATGGAITVNLPAPTLGLKFEIKLNGNNTVTLNRSGAESIDFVASNYVINNSKGAYKVISDGTDWFII